MSDNEAHDRRWSDQVAALASSKTHIARLITIRDVLIMVAACLFALAGAASFIITSEQRSDAEGRTSLANCQQIELVKSEIHKSLEQSLRTTPTLAYYRDNPVELKSSLKRINNTLIRFEPNDCYALPVVRAAGFRAPSKDEK